MNGLISRNFDSLQVTKRQPRGLLATSGPAGNFASPALIIRWWPSGQQPIVPTEPRFACNPHAHVLDHK